LKRFVVVDSAAINTGVQVALLYPAYIPSGICPGERMLDHMAVLFLVL
jgi:hypothetical protein